MVIKINTIVDDKQMKYEKSILRIVEPVGLTLIILD